MNVEDDEAGRLAGFRARFGRAYDSGKETMATNSDESSSDKSSEGLSHERRMELDDNGFAEEEEANLLDLISSYGQAEAARARKKGGGA